MKTINVEIEGKEPGLLMHRFDIDEYQSKTGKVKEKVSLEDQAKKSAYWTSGKGKKSLMIPSTNVFASMLNAASFSKVEGGRSAKSIMAGTVTIEPFEISLGTDKYEVDIRPVNNRGNRILVGRPKIAKWTASFKIIFNDDLVSDEVVKKVLTDAGIRVGLMAFRPNKGGPFGCFKIIKWKVGK